MWCIILIVYFVEYILLLFYFILIMLKRNYFQRLWLMVDSLILNSFKRKVFKMFNLNAIFSFFKKKFISKLRTRKLWKKKWIWCCPKAISSLNFTNYINWVCLYFIYWTFKNIAVLKLSFYPQFSGTYCSSAKQLVSLVKPVFFFWQYLEIDD